MRRVVVVANALVTDQAAIFRVQLDVDLVIGALLPVLFARCPRRGAHAVRRRQFGAQLGETVDGLLLGARVPCPHREAENSKDYEVALGKKRVNKFGMLAGLEGNDDSSAILIRF